MSPSESKRKSKKSASLSPEEIKIAFGTCPRCSYFLTGYRLIHDDLDQAITENQEGWIVLSWSGPMRNLVHKVYGGRIDLEVTHFSGICRECHRAYILEGDEAESVKPSFRIEVYPGSLI